MRVFAVPWPGGHKARPPDRIATPAHGCARRPAAVALCPTQARRAVALCDVQCSCHTCHPLLLFQYCTYSLTLHVGAAHLLHHGGAAPRSVAPTQPTLPPTTCAGIIDSELLSWLPKGAALVNAARGQHVDEQALLAALDSGKDRAGSFPTQRVAYGGGGYRHV